MNDVPRRDFIKTIGVSTAGVIVGAGHLVLADGTGNSSPAARTEVTIRGAFLYPPSGTLEVGGYFSWPGSTFDAEGRHVQYAARIKEIGRKLGMRIDMQQKPIQDASDVDQFIAGNKASNPDGLLLIPFKKSPCFDYLVRIVEQTKIPSVVLATLGVLLIEHIWRLKDQTGVYFISSLDDLSAVEKGMRMIKTFKWMKESTIISINGAEAEERRVPFVGTTVRQIPSQRFYDCFAATTPDRSIASLAKEYTSKATKIHQPTKHEITDSARVYYAFKRLLSEEKGDALMMTCLPGLVKPRKHVPPCMAMMTLRDEGIAGGCENDLDATLTQMLLLGLFDKPGFQQDPSYNTEQDRFFCAHCTSASRMNGLGKPAEKYDLMSHCESGFGVAPRVHFRKGQDVTLAKLTLGDKTPQLLIYTGVIVGCPPIPQAGGCRSNAEITIRIHDKGFTPEIKRKLHTSVMHAIMVYGNYEQELKQFSQLYGIEVLS